MGSTQDRPAVDSSPSHGLGLHCLGVLVHREVEAEMGECSPEGEMMLGNPKTNLKHRLPLL